MKLRVIPALVFALASWAGGEPAGPPLSPPLQCSTPPRAWLGLKIAKPDPEAIVPGLPPGMGFVVLSVGKDGPAATAGLREGDILWKLDGQMLVNESQLAALLRLARPGDRIGISGFRESKPLEIKLTLGDAAGNFPVRSAERETASAAPRHVKIAGKSATYAADGASATVSRAGDGYAVTIRSADGSVIFEGSLGAGCDTAAVPEDWKRPVRVLCRTLDHALDGRLPRGGQARPRVVPTNPNGP